MTPTPPTLVVVHGPPAAGKSTLARALAPLLDLPLFDRDDFKDVMFDTLGWSDRDWSSKVGAASWELLGLCVDRLIRGGVSLIADSNFRPADPLVQQLRRLCDAVDAVPVEVYCTALPEVLWDRFEQRRQVGGRHAGHVGFERRDEFLSDLQERRHGRLDLGGVTIEVDTTQSWPNPGLIADQIQHLTDDGVRGSGSAAP